MVSPARSPAAVALLRCLELLGKPDDPHWHVLLRTGTWSAELLDLAASSTVLFMGNMYMRTVMPLLAWPWPLARLVSEDVSEAEATAIAECYETVQ
eukprot:9344971-Alexandrium_andersonii.AAC.1